MDFLLFDVFEDLDGLSFGGLGRFLLPDEVGPGLRDNDVVGEVGHAVPDERAVGGIAGLQKQLPKDGVVGFAPLNIKEEGLLVLVHALALAQNIHILILVLLLHTYQNIINPNFKWGPKLLIKDNLV